MDSMIIILSVVSIGLLAALILVVMRRSQKPEDSGLVDTLRQRINELESVSSKKDSEIDTKNNLITSLTSEKEVYKAQAQNATNEIDSLKSQHAADIQNLKDENHNRIEELKSIQSKQLNEAKAAYERMLDQVREASQKQIENHLNLIKEQMKTTSEEILKQRQNELGERNVEQVSKIINPLMESLKGMKEAFDLSKEKQKEALTRLDETIRINTEKNASLGETADRLARALTGEVKAQGNFGELKLKQLLESMELTEGEQYDTQETLYDRFGRRLQGDDGKGFVPDFILHFPNNRHVVIDAKMSLTAFERYMNAEEGSAEKTAELHNHINSVRNNVNKLAKKAYSRFLPEGHNRLDFAFMYVPIDAALNLALLNEQTLWKEAYDKGVIILGPQTMYMNLRVLEMMWTQVRQLENQQTMIDCANHIIDRVQDFAERFRDVDSSMRDVVKKMDKFKITTASDGRSIIKAAQNLVKSGGQENRKKTPLAKSDTIFLEDDPTNLLT